LPIIAWPVDSVPLSSSVSAEMGELEARGEGVTCLGPRWISDLKELCRENFHNTVTLLDRVNAKRRGRKNKDGISFIWLTNEYRTFGIGLPPFYWGNYIGGNGVVLIYIEQGINLRKRNLS